ncbi:MAG TPA: DUF5677 domain-containing protein, partial [Rhizomicrobium sp.]|nr:DUF5677 domain-containing protein [Rhizomicrobium sp.]
KYLAHFRDVIIKAKRTLPNPKNHFITHNFLSLLTPDQFDQIFDGVLKDDEATQCLTPLRLITSLPDNAHWARRLEMPTGDIAGPKIAAAVARTFDHQSERSTDIRWMKLMYHIIAGRVSFPASMAGRLEEYRLYPDKGDMRAVRPSIRATEIAFRQFEFGEEVPKGVKLPPGHQADFWREMKARTQCIAPYEFKPPSRASKEVVQELADIFRAVQDYFDDTATTTAPDARHEGAFGITLYAISLCLNSAMGYGHEVVEGRIVLRTIVEAFITLQYLASKDDPTLWQQYRQYGTGQAKLAFLKNIREEKIPSFVDLKLMEQLANEDMWMEFQDIQLGNWANLNLRKMAEDAGVLSTYNKFYDWSSGYTHGHWVGVRSTVFVNCVNPLHRFHRVPAPPIVKMPSIIPDAAALINGMLDTLSGLYPTFKPRLNLHKPAKAKRKKKTNAPSSSK